MQALGYQMTDDSEAFEERIGKAIAELDSGDGVLVLTDLFAGTPAHKTTRYLKPGQVDVICGVNLPLFLELLGLREAGGLDLNTLMQTGKRWNPAVGSRSAAERRRFLLNSNDYDKIEDL